MEKSVFISYSHLDNEAAQKTAEVVRQVTGMTVWIDYKLRGGDNYFSVIAEQIMASSFFVFLVSGNSVQSDWCLRELEFAASERKRLLAICLEDVPIPPEIRLIIQNTHYIHYRTDDSFLLSVQNAFSKDAVQPVQNSVFFDDDGSQTPNAPHFLDAEKIKKIEGLLNAQKAGKFSACFRPENACLLGLAYELGIGIDIDLRQAEFFYKISDYNGSYDGKFLYTALQQKKGHAQQDQRFLSKILDSAEHGSAYALTALGSSCYYGLYGYDINYEKAYTFWKKAADAGSTTAMYKMACGYRKGGFLHKDPDLTYMYAALAAERGYPPACRLLASMYEYGEFFEQDLQKAAALYVQAQSLGDLLSLCYEGQVRGKLGDISGMRKLYQQAVEYARQGKISSGLPFFCMGSLCETGKEVPQDWEQATKYYLEGAERQHRDSMHCVVPAISKIPDVRLHRDYLEQAYYLQCSGAAFALGKLLAEQSGSDRLPERTLACYTAGAEAGDMNCAVALIHNFSWVIGQGKSREDQQNAIKWFRFLFANIDSAFLARMRKSNTLATYYYAYAVELDDSYGAEDSDREFVKLYFEKSLRESPVHLLKIICFAVDGYLFPENSGSRLKLDVVHTEEVLSLAEKHLYSYCRYLMQENLENFSRQWQRLREKLELGYTKIADCYNTGNLVPKNKAVAKDYRSKAASVEKLLDEISTGMQNCQF